VLPMYNKINNLFLLAVLLVFFNSADGQTADTTALVENFNKVMSFTNHLYLHYNTFTKMVSDPVIQSEDTLSFNGEFYKYKNDFYCNSGQEEVFIEDSLMIRVNHQRKEIWISKMDTTTKNRAGASPIGSMDILKKIKDNYAISDVQKDTDFATIQLSKTQINTPQTTMIAITYDKKTFLPLTMELKLKLDQRVDDDEINSLKEEGIQQNKLIKTIDKEKYLSRQQGIIISFKDINTTIEKAKEIPSWKEVLGYNFSTGEFIGKGRCSDYEITKTF